MGIDKIYRTVNVKNVAFVTLLLMISSLASGHNAPIRVVTSFSILSDFVKNVGGQRVIVINLAPAGTDAHNYQSSAQDIKNIASAKLVFINGLGFESWFDKLLNQTINKDKISTASYGITPNKFEEDGKTVDDPHMWWDLTKTQKYITNIQRALSKAHPDNQAYFEANEAKFNKELANLDIWAKQQIDKIPVQNRKLVTNHDSLGYLANRYGLKVIGSVIPSIGTEREPSAKEINELVKKIKAEKVKAIFIENTVNARLAQTIANEAGVKIAPPLYTDALGSTGSNGDTFIKAFRYNIETITTNLR